MLGEWKACLYLFDEMESRVMIEWNGYTHQGLLNIREVIFIEEDRVQHGDSVSSKRNHSEIGRLPIVS